MYSSPHSSMNLHLQPVAELEIPHMESSPGGRLGQPVPEVHCGRTILVLSRLDFEEISTRVESLESCITLAN